MTVVNTFKLWSAEVPLDQYKPGDPVCLRVVAGWRQKYKLCYYKPTKAEWEAYQNAEIDISPDEKPPKKVYLKGRIRVWKQRIGYEVLAIAAERRHGKNVERVKIRRVAVPEHTFPSRWYPKERVLHRVTFQLHDMGEHNLWTTLDSTTGKYRTTHPDGTVKEGVLRKHRKAPPK